MFYRKIPAGTVADSEISIDLKLKAKSYFFKNEPMSGPVFEG